MGHSPKEHKGTALICKHASEWTTRHKTVESTGERSKSICSTVQSISKTKILHPLVHPAAEHKKNWAVTLIAKSSVHRAQWNEAVQYNIKTCRITVHVSSQCFPYSPCVASHRSVIEILSSYFVRIKKPCWGPRGGMGRCGKRSWIVLLWSLTGIVCM